MIFSFFKKKEEDKDQKQRKVAMELAHNETQTIRLKLKESIHRLDDFLSEAKEN